MLRGRAYTRDQFSEDEAEQESEYEVEQSSEYEAEQESKYEFERSPEEYSELSSSEEDCLPIQPDALPWPIWNRTFTRDEIMNPQNYVRFSDDEAEEKTVLTPEEKDELLFEIRAELAALEDESEQTPTENQNGSNPAPLSPPSRNRLFTHNQPQLPLQTLEDDSELSSESELDSPTHQNEFNPTVPTRRR